MIIVHPLRFAIFISRQVGPGGTVMYLGWAATKGEMKQEKGMYNVVPSLL